MWGPHNGMVPLMGRDAREFAASFSLCIEKAHGDGGSP